MALRFRTRILILITYLVLHYKNVLKNQVIFYSGTVSILSLLKDQMFAFVQTVPAPYSIANPLLSTAHPLRRHGTFFLSRSVRHSLLSSHFKHFHEPNANKGALNANSIFRGSLCMKNDSSSTSVAVRVFSALLIAGLVISSLLPLAGVLQNNLTDNGDVTVSKKLGRVPVFTVTDLEGHPYLTEAEGGRLRRGYFFVQPEDAKKYLETVQTGNEGQAKARVLPVTLNEALKYLMGQGSAPKSIPEKFQLFPDRHEQELANEVSDGEFEKLFGGNAVPVFYLEGLAFEDDQIQSGAIIPLFFEKEKLEETLSELKSRNPETTLNAGAMQVFNLMDTIREIRSGSDSRFQRVAYIPLTQSIRTLQELNKQ